ncbi:MAG: hypothetical protein Crog4KO_23710 [Crocinitomicaceae bacterium]
MKKQLLSLVMLLIASNIFAQTDELNLQKYWKFRNNFVEKFVKIGDQPGESFPIGVRSPSTYCYDNVGGGHSGALFWGDGGVRHGHYLTLLATEYALLKKNNQTTEGVLNELYYALYALNRVDEFAEAAIDYNYGIDFYYGPELNGFYLREDIPEDFNLNWQTDNLDPRCIYSPNYTNNNVQKANNGSDQYTTPETSYQNTPSVDQMISILLGIRMIHKLVDNVEVQPTSGDDPMYIVSEAVAIADRMIKYAADHNWVLIDVNGWPVNSNGGDLSIASYPLLKTWEALNNGAPFPYNQESKRRAAKYINVQHCLTGYGVNQQTTIAASNACVNLGPLESVTYTELYGGQNAGNLNNQDVSVFQDWVQSGAISSIASDFAANWTNAQAGALNFEILQNYVIQITEDAIDPTELETYDLNVKLAFYLATASSIWDPITVDDFAGVTENYELELVNALLTGDLPLKPSIFFKAKLDSLGISGPYSLTQNYPPDQDTSLNIIEAKHQSGGWASGYRWINKHDYGTLGGLRKGLYSAMDYMVMHNLYQLVYENASFDFEEDYQCLCENQPFVQVAIPNDAEHVQRITYLNDKLGHVPACEEHIFEDDLVLPSESPFLVNPYFDDYADLKISTAKFNMENTTIADGASVIVNSHLIVCNGTTLTAMLGSNVDVNKADIRINDQGTLDVSGDVLIRNGNKVHIKDGAKLILRNGSELRIQEGGQLIIDGELEYYDGASIITENDNAEIVLNGTIKMMDGGTFTCGNTPGQPTGRLVINSSEAKFSKAMNAGYCEVHLSGQNDDDEFLVLKKDASLKFMHNAVININKLTVSACKVLMEENSRIEVRQELNAYNAKFIASDVNQGIHIARANQFTAVDFQNVNIHANLNIIHGHKLRMTSCTMTNLLGGTDPAEPLIDVNGTGMAINNCTFVGDNEYYIYAENLNYPSSVSSSTFNGSSTNNTSVGIEDRSNAELKVYQNTFNYMHIGVRKLYDPVTAKCNTFNESIHSDIGAVYGSNAIVTTDNYGGYNSFNSADATHGNIWLWYGDLDISNGRNYFNPSSDKHIYARMNYPCPNNLYCYINADNNQWNTGTQLPANNKFDVIGSDLSPIDIDINTTEVMPACGFYDGQYTTSTDILPNVTTSLGDLPLDKAIHFARQEMTINDSTANDEDALKLFDEIFRDSVLLDSFATRKWMYRALADMKSALESEYYMQTILQESGQNPVMDYVNNYLNALNYMTPTTLTADNYRQAFHLELDKVQLYRMMEMPEDGLEILEQTELCGLDSTEQEIVNYWKEQIEYDLLYDVWGMDILDTAINVDTRSYIRPTSNPAISYNFGTFFNSLTDRTYAQCSGGERIAQDQKEQPLVILGVYPVPADEVINITINAEDGVVLNSIRLYDAMGRLMGEIELSVDQTEVRDYSIQSWSTGVYYYNVSGPSGTFGGGTFVVE